MNSLIVPKELFEEVMDMERIEYLNELFRQEMFEEFNTETEKVSETL